MKRVKVLAAYKKNLPMDFPTRLITSLVDLFTAAQNRDRLADVAPPLNCDVVMTSSLRSPTSAAGSSSSLLANHRPLVGKDSDKTQKGEV